METSTMKYPFGRCSCCGNEFNSELRNEYQIEHCPWCGEGIDDFMSPSAQVHPNDIYCEDCGQRIYERSGVGGRWLTLEGDEKQPGQCSGPCERELCGNCGDWDYDGLCPKCHMRCEDCPETNCPTEGGCEHPCLRCEEKHGCYDKKSDKMDGCEEYNSFIASYKDEKPQQCAQCGVMTDNIVNEEHCCPDCEKELLEQGEKNPFKGREDEHSCHCNNCEAKFMEGEIKIKDDIEHCPSCGMAGCIADDEERQCTHCGEMTKNWTVIDARCICSECEEELSICWSCPAENCSQTPNDGCANPCRPCPQKNDCHNDNTDIRNQCHAFIKFAKSVGDHDPCGNCKKDHCDTCNNVSINDIAACEKCGQ